MLANNFLTKISDFSYELPDEKIAKHPLEKRDASKLLVFRNDEIFDETFKNCINFLPENSLVIFNNTRVIHARIILQKSTGAKIEILCLEPNNPCNYEQSFAKIGECSWKCVVGNAKKWKDEPLHATLDENNIVFTAEKGERTEDGFIVTFRWNGNKTFSEILEQIGKIPIPPYLNRESEDDDNIRYQTIFAENNGSVAAPTAGLHFTPEVLSTFPRKNIEVEKVTLHVGAGTFKPVKTELYTDHIMHQELCIVKKTLVQNILKHIPLITAVGTTSVRTLESLYWIGVKLYNNTQTDISHLSQWEAYNLPQDISTKDALTAILTYMEMNNLREIQYYTQIMITPKYKFRLVTSMFTNFHQPQSTLLLLISAFIGENWKTIYKHALENKYRFLSYGDSSLLIP
ncbi:MAG: S-adenosylmethionine:tRNA ribosyltransferase-isomerase [Bacteroidales bacterium]|nr:S-adenosylmethionine:tRNA ribosyltransferase-isomerase [Bacteroidales bacterium]